MATKDSHDKNVLWRPAADAMQQTQMGRFLRAAQQASGTPMSNYDQLWAWSVRDRAGFWSLLWKRFDVISSRTWDEVLTDGDAMPGARWFSGARLNFAENLLRHRDDHPALIYRGEDGRELRLSYAEVAGQAGRLAASMQQMGVGPGDRVAAVLPNCPQAIIGMLATSWLGAIWSSCSPDFGSDGILDRFAQIGPELLIGTDGYRFKGRQLDVRDKLARVAAGLPDCPHRVMLSWQGLDLPDGWHAWQELLTHDQAPPPFAQLAFDHPLYILFSSGTTGSPKCIVHGAGGTLLQHLKEHRLHCDLRRDDRLFYFTTCGWMMWNWLASGLATGATLVLFDGNPFHPAPDSLPRMADELGVTIFGTSAKYISALQQAGVRTCDSLSLAPLRAMLSTGSPLAPESFDYLLDAIKPGLQISSISGGTDIVSCFALGNPLVPVRRGELQSRGLGLAVEVFNDQGQPVIGEPGELVCTKPFPNMPVSFWNDPDGSRYHAAYFERFPGVWTHGDWTTLTEHGGLIIDGRSDAVLNPGGVRIGTAEIYRQVEKLPRVRESICVGQPWQGDVRVVLFVVLAEGDKLDDELCGAIRGTLREHASPRHVPAKIAQVRDIPRTRSGKNSELAVRDTVIGRKVSNTTALANPEVLEQYRDRVELST